ncbi:MAG: ABC-F family ATP-binding cassette domain-containing protein [Bacteroidales bacterium]|nr:ABC-F family ATP-binding cassette domain-containing protein [Bacteroidales bacterium]MCI6680267.1 ABC-F family ATP-binding cassette domain-containing protein [Bacteroides sp.]MDY5890436.1 ABC-F family ATP-binding cassette domain-containing protein [Candidatus Cryptobacteroides sp.]
MPSFLQIENISKSYGPKILFEHIRFNVNEGDKIALIAPNGTGKTSLLRILAGKDKSDSGGKILFLKDIRIAFLEQEYDCDPQNGILDQILLHCQNFLSHCDDEHKAEFVQKVKEFLGNFGLHDTNRKMGELSGGEVKRVALSEMLASQADFLIMDEPTNHLDIEAIEYLESYLKRNRCTLLMVTHDRYFLDRVCNIVMELDHGAIYSYKGDYQNYLEKREERISSYNAQTDKVRNILRRELEWIHATPCARSGKAKYRINAFHELSERASQAYSTKQISLDGVGEASRLGSKIINCKNVNYFWEGGCLLKDFSYNFQRYDKVGIVGRNGVGKSTFLDLLTGAIQPSSGIIERGESLVIGYYRQEGMDFSGDDTVLDIVGDTRLLGRFLFPHDMLNTKVSRLSGGEKRRLYLLTILMKNPNLLILDEPTNDLDIVTLNILEEYLKEYGGSLIIVSHDRHFLDRVVEHLLVFCGDGIVKDFIGTFSEYRSYVRDYEASQKKEPSEPKPAEPAKAQKAPDNKPRKLSFKEKRELELIESRLPELEELKKTIETDMNSGTLAYDKLSEKAEEFKRISSEIDELETRWLELQNQ